MFLHFRFSLCLACLIVSARHGVAIEIVVDYTYDTLDFFDTSEKRDALQAAADRFSRVITSPLLAVAPSDSEPGWRIGFRHPGTGEPYELSTARSRATDPISSANFANDYGFGGLKEDVWTLYAGGRRLESGGQGGTATGTNFESTFDDLNGPTHRGLISNTPEDTVSDLPVWGGAIAFSTELDWHFGMEETTPSGTFDFYSIALHEIGHALGLASGNWNQVSQYIDDDQYDGPAALNAYNEDNGTSLRSLKLNSEIDPHWADGTYQSFVFPLGQPNRVGTVDPKTKQDLLMEPVSNFVFPTPLRFEITNVDVGALVDIGWSVLSFDLDADGIVDGNDVNLACTESLDVTAWLGELGAIPGDLNLDGRVAFPDFLTLSANFAGTGRYTDGDINCDNQVSFPDFLVMSANFGQSAAALSTVPEPAQTAFVWILLASFYQRFRRKREVVSQIPGI